MKNKMQRITFLDTQIRNNRCLKRDLIGSLRQKVVAFKVFRNF